MKKMLVIFFTLFYSMASIGMPLNIHFCHGEVKDLAIYSQTDDCCPDSEAEFFSCCEENSLQLQIKSHQITGKSFAFFPVHFISGRTFEISSAPVEGTEKIFSLSSQPSPKKEPVFLVNCSLVFYG